MRQPVPPGRHRAPGHGRYVTLRRVPARHHRPGTARSRAYLDRTGVRIGAVTVMGTIAAADVLLGGLLVDRAGQPAPRAGVPLPTISVGPPATGGPDLSPPRAQHVRHKPRPPVLLGPPNLAVVLAGYCRNVVAGAVGASPGSDTWQCDRRGGTPVAIDMDAACRWRYGRAAWAGMLDDDDQRTWRCYRDPS